MSNSEINQIFEKVIRRLKELSWNSQRTAEELSKLSEAFRDLHANEDLWSQFIQAVFEDQSTDFLDEDGNCVPEGCFLEIPHD